MDPITPRSIPEVLRGRRLVVAVTGGISAFKSAALVSSLVQGGAQVRVVMTPSAQRFISPLTLAALSQNPVMTDIWAASESGVEAHVELAEWAEAILVHPATASTLARLAHGLADDAVSATVLASDAPLVLAPAMHDRMYRHPATRANLETLVGWGATVAAPRSGRLASGRIGEGRLAPEEDVIEALARALGPQPLRGERVVVTAGGTRESIDPVRYISNRSSGRMGFALARAAARLGAEVTLVTTMDPPPLAGVAVLRVETAAEMAAVLQNHLAAADILFMAAAVADHRPAHPGKQKEPKTSGSSALELVANPDIVAGLSAEPGRHALIVAFAAETTEVEARAEAKLRRKGADLIVANDVSAADSGMGSEYNAVTVLAADGGRWEIPRALKDEVAARLLDIVLEVRAGRTPRPSQPAGRRARRTP